jgi:transcriptional regulator with XRE-family HTH domain
MAALKLRMLRINRGLSRNALGRQTGVSTPTITRLEAGQLPTEATAYKLATFFDLKPTELWPQLAEDREPAA